MELHTLITCLIAVTLLTLTPGVDTMLIIRNSARGGWQDGVTSSLGICSGLFIHAAISALGISMVLLHTAWAFTAMKAVGAGYLIWLGLGSLRQGWRNEAGQLAGPAATASVASFRWQRSFREGFLSNVLNPKAVIFYMAFLPQFIDPTQPPLGQSLLVATLHFTVAMCYQCLLASMVDRARIWLANPKVNRLFNLLTGMVLVAIGARLAVSR